MESTILLFTNVCVSEITAINMSLTKEDNIKGLKEVTRKLEEGDEIDSSTMGIVEECCDHCTGNFGAAPELPFT